MGELDYIYILKALREIPFSVGKKLLIEFLQGKTKHESIKKNNLDQLKNFGALAYDSQELTQMIDNLIFHKLIRPTSLSTNTYWKVLELTSKGHNEIIEPKLHKRKFSFQEQTTTITSEDERLFAAFGPFLEGFNLEQKKAIISPKNKILCIAGAGSGKTTVLTNRIDFLIKYRSADPGRILAITFTRKARREMQRRLERLGHHDTHIETFNSFCEKILKRHNNILYDQQMKVVTYKDKIHMLNKALSNLDISLDRATSIYFTYAQQRSKTREQLANIFMNDCFFLRDYFKFKHRPLKMEYFESDDQNKRTINLVFGVCSFIDAYMKKHGFRDFADQIIDALELFSKRPDLIPKFDHILIDEYQDVNSSQMRLVNTLSPANLFCVGDPRQSIYGWRGSDIRFILNFEEDFPGTDTDIINLKTNYRSTQPIVELSNRAIKKMRLTDLEAHNKGKKDIHLLRFDSEGAEFEFIIQKILSTDLPRKEIFVLARTNRQLGDLSQIMKMREIPHIVRSDEVKKTIRAGKDDVTLATVHAIKGLEAELVFVIGATAQNFPCKGSEHPVVDMIKVKEYDKEEEERRLFYVAISRAKSSLIISYTGKKPTYFLTKEMLDYLEEREVRATSKIDKFCANPDLIERLKHWRKAVAQENRVPAFLIMHDSTLQDIVQKMPLTKSDLEDVNGLGPTKIMRYGDDILKIVSC